MHKAVWDSICRGKWSGVSSWRQFGRWRSQQDAPPVKKAAYSLELLPTMLASRASISIVVQLRESLNHYAKPERGEVGVSSHESQPNGSCVNV